MGYRLGKAEDEFALQERLYKAKTRKVEREKAHADAEKRLKAVPNRLYLDTKQAWIEQEWSEAQLDLEWARSGFAEAHADFVEARLRVRDARIAQLMRRVRVLRRRGQTGVRRRRR